MHIDPDALALMALGESAGTDEARAHAASCPDCAGELDDLYQVVAEVRLAGPDPLAAPADRVWERIRDELGLDVTPATSVQAPAPINPRRTVGETSPRHAESAAEPEGRPTPRALRRKVAVVLAALARSLSAKPWATAQLAPVEQAGSQASGSAHLVTDELGRQILHLALRTDLPSSGVRQAWLVNRHDPDDRQTVGILDGRHGVWTIDRSIDLEAYAILDISQQQAGDTVHSGHSLVRGELVASH